MKRFQFVLGFAVLASASVAQAQPCAQSFGTIAAATFNGTAVSSGIPNNQVAMNTCVSNLTLGLTAHARGNGNPAVSSNGVSTFFASAGADVSSSPPAGATYATWNFGFYVGGTAAASYAYRLYYDVNAASANSGLGYVQWSGTGAQDSWNLGMAFLSDPLIVTQAPTGTFDRFAAGDYAFRLVAYTDNTYGNEVAATGMNVTTTPEPSTYFLMASGLAVLGVVARRRRNVTATR